ncbi:ribonuclease III [Clavulina sp. PMI_390]|nr:ribonuclease III [Clavulina sp. PMI_390]
MALRASSSAIKSGLSALPRAQFPPPELRNAAVRVPGAKLTPAEWGTLQAPSPAALSALAARLQFSVAESNSPSTSQKSQSRATELLEQALTHPSCLSLYSKHYPNAPLPSTNQALATVGNGLLGLFASEWIHATYPHLPGRAAKAAVSAYVGPRTLADVAKEWGAPSLLRWSQKDLSTGQGHSVLQVTALASFPRALVALIARHVSLAAARKFVHDHFLSRAVDLQPLLKFRAPKTALTETVAKFGRERPVSRLLKETGRHTNTPIFVVGIYSGADKLGEGFGNSIKMAEYRAAEDALNRVYLTQQPSHLFDLPTSTFPTSFQTSEHPPSIPYGSYTAPILGESEVLYASAGKTGTRASGLPSGRRSEGSTSLPPSHSPAPSPSDVD